MNAPVWRETGRLIGGLCCTAIFASVVALEFLHLSLEGTESEIASLRSQAALMAQVHASRAQEDRALLAQVDRELAQSSSDRDAAMAKVELQAEIAARQQGRIEQLKAERTAAVQYAADQARLLVDRDAKLEQAISAGTRLARERDQAIADRTMAAQHVSEQARLLVDIDAKLEQAINESTQRARERDHAIAGRDATIIETRRALRQLDAETRTAIADIEKVIVAAGLEPSRVLTEPDLFHRVSARGGPYLPWKAEVQFAEHVESRQLHTLSLQVEKLKSLRDVMVRLPLVAPVTHAILSDGFGYRRDPVNGGGARHEGLDLRAVRDSAVVAPATGTVIAAGWDGAFGNLIQIDHGFGVVSRYAHLSRMLVRKGDVVARDEQIGMVGATGRATGVHLHYEIWVDGQPRDPMRFITAVSRPFVGFVQQ